MNTNATGQPRAAHPPIGIDLGTTYSVVAFLEPGGKPVTIPNGAGDMITPSALLFEDGEVVVGREAAKSSAMLPDSFSECFKRDIGSDQYHRKVCGIDVPPEVLSGFVLQRLKEDAERQLGPIRQVVITVPAFFDESRRKATQDAGKLAGLEVLDIINEPTAAAVAYGYQQGFLNTTADGDGSNLQRVLVYDLGGGTFDATILEIHGTRLRAVATDGDVYLGGKDFDERIVDFLAEGFITAHGIDPREDPQDAAQMWLDAQQAKHTLSERNRATIVCFHAGLRHRVEITREVFEDMTRDLLERTETTTSLLVKDAGLTWDQIDRVLLVGGSSRMPMVLEMLRRITGKEPDRTQSPDNAIAHGAAIYAGMLMAGAGGENSSCQLLNVNSHSLGIVGLDRKSRMRVNVILIPKNTRLPCRAAKKFVTARDNQRSVQVTVVEGESQRPSECIQLGECVVRGLPPGLPKNSPVQVEYSYASNGRISVSARIPGTRQSARVEIVRDRSRDLESLDTWRARIFGLADGGTAPERGPIDLNDPGSIVSRLDKLYSEIGKAALSMALPKTLKRTAGSVETAWQELEQAQTALEQAESGNGIGSGAAESILSKSRLANARRRLEQARVGYQFAYVALGRECIAAGVAPPGVEQQIAEAGQLRERLQQLTA